MKRIRQANVSSAICTFESDFRKRFDLDIYSDPDAPSIFFGCYTYRRPDLDILLNHRGLAVLVWGGSDAAAIRKNPKYYKRLMFKKNIRHIAISKFISDDLLEFKIPHIYLPICPTYLPGKWKPVPKGPCIYTYTGRSDAHREQYGWPIVKQVMKRLPQFEYLVGYPSPPHFSPEQMPEIYSRCFIGLRLLKHDGLSNTVVQMGLMGRKVIWNGLITNAIPWKTVDDIVHSIEEESLNIGMIDPVLSSEVESEVDIGEDWLRTDFYESI